MATQVLFAHRRVYVLRGRVGSGMYGEVFAAVDVTDEWRHIRAVKRLFPGNPDQPGPRRAFANELSYQWAMTDAHGGPHPNIVSIVDGFGFRDDYYIVMEWCHGSVAHLFALPGYRGEDWLLPVARGLLGGLDWVHYTGHLHNDVHAGNVLFQRRNGPFRDPLLADALSGPGLYTFKLTDFGFGGNWATLPNEQEEPTMMSVDMNGAARVLIDVAHGRAGASQERHAIEGVPERFRDPIRRALEGDLDFDGQRVARDMLRALSEA